MKINKSSAIRKQLRSSRNHNPTAIVKALKAKGISVSPGLVSVVKFNRRKPKISHHAAILTHAKQFLRAAGGPEEAKNLIDLIHKIVS